MKKVWALIMSMLLALVPAMSLAEAAEDLDAAYAAAMEFYDAGDYATAVPLLEELAEKGHAEAMTTMGNCYLDGHHADGTPDDEKALAWYQKALDAGSIRAMHSLGNGYAQGKLNNGVPDYEKAREWYLKAAEAGYTDSMYNLGWYYNSGHFTNGVPDYEKALEWYLKAAEAGNTNAMYGLGWCYNSGNFTNGVPDYEKALEWYLKAAEAGHGSAMNNLGAGYNNGNFSDGIPDYETAKEWFLKAAEAGNATAMRNLGKNYSNGHFTGGTPDYEKTLEWYLKAAEAGDDGAMLNLGWHYDKGHFTDGAPDYEKAMEWWLKAAEAGNNTAMYNIGRHYAHDANPLDYDKAHEWLLKAFEAGYAGAADSLGNHSSSGDFTGEPDYEAAVEWWQKAYDAGYADAAYHLGNHYFSGDSTGEPDYAQALAWYLKAEEAGVSNSTLYRWLGWFYQGNQPEICPPDHVKAAAYLEKAAGMGNTGAMRSLAVVYLNGQFNEDGTVAVPQDVSKAIDLYVDLTLADDLQSAETLARIYLDKKTAADGTVLVDQDLDAGYLYLDIASRLGTTDAHLLEWVGWFCAGNAPEVCGVDYDKAISAYEASAAQGSIYALTQLAAIYQEDKIAADGTVLLPQNLEKAIDVNRKLAEAKVLGGAEYLALLYLNGKTDADGTVLVEKDLQAGFEYTALAAELGTRNEGLLDWLGWFHAGNAPEVTPVDLDGMLAAYNRAVELGSTFAAERLAYLWLDGRTLEDGSVLVEKNSAKAFDALTHAYAADTQDTFLLDWLGWFHAGNAPEVTSVDADSMLAVYTRSADLGSSYAMFMLGEQYRLGNVISADDALARQWLTRAQEAGYQLTEEAQSFLDAE